MNDEDFANLVESIKEAAEIMRGEREPSRVFVVTPSGIEEIDPAVYCSLSTPD
jgi:hypothetical protein